ncbi:MAG TPA: hypothetical protein PLN95_04280 [Candidatus Saccharibacteria bacterium]|nr:hypothetical protein [Candidatus Saccharibacteria bacterium]
MLKTKKSPSRRSRLNFVDGLKRSLEANGCGLEEAITDDHLAFDTLRISTRDIEHHHVFLPAPLEVGEDSVTVNHLHVGVARPLSGTDGVVLADAVGDQLLDDDEGDDEDAVQPQGQFG